MGLPLILALAGQAAQMSAEDTERVRAEEAAKKQSIYDIQAQEEMDRRQKEKDRMAAMSRLLEAGPEPMDFSTDKVVPKKVDYDPTLAQTVAGVGRLAQQLGNYYAANPSTNTGGKSYYGTPTASGGGWA